MKAKSKALNKNKSLICGTVVLLAAIVSIIGLFLNFVQLEGTPAKDVFVKLFDLEETWGIISIIVSIIATFSCLALVVIAMAKVTTKAKIKRFDLLFSFMAILFGILTYVSCSIYCSETATHIILDWTIKFMPAIGAYMISIGAVVCGVFGLINKS